MKKTVLAVATLLSACMPQRPIEWYLEQGVDALRHARYAEGLRRFRQADALFLHGDAACKCYIGFCYAGLTPDDLTEAMRWWQEAAGMGDAEAQYQLAYRYCMGAPGVEPDAAQAIGWLHRAVEQNHRAAQRLLSNCYLYGRGVEPNDRQALYWMERAAETGDEEACEYLELLRLLLELKDEAGR